MCSAAMLRSKRSVLQMNTSTEVRDRKHELAKMNQSLQILLSQNGPGASEVAAELKDLLENTLKASVLAAKDSLQTELSNHYAKGFDACDAVLAAAQGSDGAVATKQASFETSRAKHVSCRTLEAESKTTFDACAEEEEKLKVAKESACKAGLTIFMQAYCG